MEAIATNKIHERASAIFYRVVWPIMLLLVMTEKISVPNLNYYSAWFVLTNNFIGALVREGIRPVKPFLGQMLKGKQIVTFEA